tara:strand:- start:200 stop:448 length:249 start_codon:yes stop_codon:yes gene_type:complete
MYLIIEKIDYVNISPSFNVVSYSKEQDLADRYAQCKRDEANEQGKENYSYDVVQFLDLAETGAELDKALNVLENKLGLKDVN